MSIPIGSRVEVYWNLHKSCYSVKHNGKVVLHTNKLALTDVTFAVQPAGRKRVLEEKQKNVHAFVRGNYAGDNFQDHIDCCEIATYNPYKYETFVTKEDGQPLYKCDKAFLTKQVEISVPLMLIQKGN
jgi:hypothetical protein